MTAPGIHFVARFEIVAAAVRWQIGSERGLVWTQDEQRRVIGTKAPLQALSQAASDYDWSARIVA